MQESASSLRNALLSAGLVAIALMAYWPSTAALWGFWTNDNRSGTHGLLVAPLAVWLLYRARYRLAAVEVRPSRIACGLLLLCSIAWLVFWRAGIQELHLLLLPFLMGLAIFASLGFRAARIVALPLGYLYFAVPAWGIFGRPLQDLTIDAVGALAPLIGVPAHIQGDLVLLPGVGVIEIASSCSGVNFLTIGLAVAALLGELERASLRRRALLAVVMGTLALVSNWLRVLIIVEAGYATHMRHVLVSRSHYMFGWVLFTTVMVAFVWLLARPDTSAARATNFPLGGPLAARTSAYVTTVIALVAMPLLVYMIVTRLDASATSIAFAAPLGRAGWEGPVSGASDPWKPAFAGAHSQWYSEYQGAAGHRVEMVAIGYPMQAQGRELVSEENSLFGATSLAAVAKHTVVLDGQPYIETVAADDSGGRFLVWSIYDIGGRRFVTPLMSQLWYGVRSLEGPPYSILFAFRTACEGSCDAARDVLRSFAQTMGGPFFQSVSRTPPTHFPSSSGRAESETFPGVPRNEPLTAVLSGAR
jgi:EpsI family protein